MSNDRLSLHLSRILHMLRGVRSRRENAALLRGLADAAAAGITLFLTAVAIEAFFRFAVGGRTMLAALVAVLALAAIGSFVIPPLLRKFGLLKRVSEDEIALQVGLVFPRIKDRLLNALQIYRESLLDSRPSYSQALIDASFSEAAGEFETLDLKPVVDERPLKKSAGRLLAVALFAAAAFAAFPGTLIDAAGRIARFRTDFAPPAPFEFIISPGDIEAVKGRAVTLTALTTLKTQPSITFYIREEQQSDFDAAETKRDSTGKFTASVAALRSGIVYYAEAEGYRSRQYAITVVDRPFVRSMRLKLDFPSYTRLSPRYLEDNAGDVTALLGTRIEFELGLNKEVASAALVFDDSAVVAMNVDGKRARTAVILNRDRKYRIDLKDAAGIRNSDPITWKMQATPDMRPAIELLEPSLQSDVDESMRLPVLARISDDFGFTKLILHYRLASSKYERPQETYSSILLPLPSERKPEMDVPYIWNLVSLSLVPEDVVQFYLEVFDNDAVSGPKSARTALHTLRLPSMEEVFARVDRTQEKAAADLQKALSGAEDVQKQVEKLQREMKQQNTEKLDWQQKRALEEALKKQEKILEDLKTAKEELSRLNQDMQKQNLVSDETMRKYQELKELMEQVDAPQLRDAMKRLNEAMKQLTPEQMKQAVENFRFNEDMFRKSIERTIELLKRLQIEQKTDEVTRRSEELARKQEELAEKTSNADPGNQDELDRLAREQRELREQAEAMKREMEELRRKMEEFPQEMPLSEMQEAEAEMNSSGTQQEMSEAESQCQGGNCSAASQSQKKSASRMRKVHQKMQQVRKKLNENQQRMIQQAFKRALDNVLDLSHKQEALRNETSSLPPNSQKFREMQQQQADLMDQLGAAANELMELAKKSFSVTPEMGMHLGEALKKMRQSQEHLHNRNNRAAGEQQGGAMTQLNEAAKQIAKGMQASSSGGGQGGSMMMQLQQMAQQQMSLNQGTQQMMQQGRMAQQQLAQMQKLAQQQMALRKSLQDLNEEAKRSAEGKRLLGDLNRIAEEMQEVVRDMQQNDVNPNTLQIQERILSRLLDASRSMRERDWEKKRRGETGSDVARRGPSALDPASLEAPPGLKDDLRKAVSEGYARDYENLIRQYFDALEKVVGSTP